MTNGDLYTGNIRFDALAWAVRLAGPSEGADITVKRARVFEAYLSAAHGSEDMSDTLKVSTDS